MAGCHVSQGMQSLSFKNLIGAIADSQSNGRLILFVPKTTSNYGVHAINNVITFPTVEFSEGAGINYEGFCKCQSFIV
jgi:hypothetical protein